MIGIKIFIYGSLFDPITKVHLWTASTVAHRATLDKVIFLPCASNRVNKQLQTVDEHRWNMISLAIKDNPTLVADDYENTYCTILGFRIVVDLHQKEIGIK